MGIAVSQGELGRRDLEAGTPTHSSGKSLGVQRSLI